MLKYAKSSAFFSFFFIGYKPYCHMYNKLFILLQCNVKKSINYISKHVKLNYKCWIVKKAENHRTSLLIRPLKLSLDRHIRCYLLFYWSHMSNFKTTK